MKKLLKTLNLFDSGKHLKDSVIFLKWLLIGKPIPPPHVVKKKLIARYQKESKLKILIETGTYYGEMVYAMRKIFNKIYSIELSTELSKLAKTRFLQNKNIEIIHGDSGRVLKEIVKSINAPAIFWLDGHYSGGVTAKGDTETPIFNELRAIFSSKYKQNIILIDDARNFGTNPAYPKLEELKNFLKENNYKNITVVNDIIRITN